METESERHEVITQTGARGKQKTAIPIVAGLILGFLLVLLLKRSPAATHGLHVSSQMIATIFIAITIFLRSLPFLIQKTIGTIGLVQISSPEFEQRIRNRYQAETATLTDLGFYHLFFAGDDTSVFRILLIFPAMVVFSMWRKRVPMIVQGGRLRTGNPVFLSRDKSAFAHPNSLGVTFHTAFQDGTLLVTKNFGDDTRYIPSIVGNARPGASIGSLWAAHQQRLQALVAEGRRVDCQTSFQAYAEIVRKEQTRG